MAFWKLIVEDFGKIKSAEIEVAPLTLFVGDNNSGKSYLLSLIWGIKNLGIETFLNYSQIEKKELIDWMTEKITTVMTTGSCKFSLETVEDMFEEVLNDQLKKEKEEFVKRIFNSDKVSIGKLYVQFENLKNIDLEVNLDENERLTLNINRKLVLCVNMKITEIKPLLKTGVIQWAILQNIYIYILKLDDIVNDDNRCIYLPAARTGFMLTKDIINKVGRQNTFNISTEKETITPFIRPINQFLDVMTDLTTEYTRNKELLELSYAIEKELASGIVEISSMPNKEVQYVPDGFESGIPLRLTSAVVTELSPLILILKHKQLIESFCYEEPEMCLHPQLQHKMGKMIGRMVNSGIEMIITTHSDLILQHINNMIKLSNREDKNEICQKLGYTSKDLLTGDNVRVYQFETKMQEKTEVKELVCGENGFVVPTFNNALDLIMDEAYEIQG